MHPLNCYCVWVFKKHYLRKSASRKPSPYFRCEATCKVEGCDCKVKITINEESDCFGKSVFIGNVNHKTGALAFRQIKGEKRSLEKQTYKNNINIPPSKIFKEKISNIDAEVYVSGNRNDCSTNKVHQNIKNEVKKQKTSLTNIHSDLMTLQEELKNKDEQEALSLCHDFRRMFGYIQDFSITNDHIKVLLFDEGMIRIYHQIVPKDILYIDCSGYLISQIHNISRIFNYCIAILHPISKAPALPVFDCIAYTHTTESVRSMLVHFKSKENFIFGNHAKPKLIVCDFSKVLINACLFEFNGQTSTEYLDRSYKNLVENEETCTLQNSN